MRIKTRGHVLAVFFMLVLGIISTNAYATLITRGMTGIAIVDPNAVINGLFTYDSATDTNGVGQLTGFKDYAITAFELNYVDRVTATSWMLLDLKGTTFGLPFSASVDTLDTWLLSGLDVSIPTWGLAIFENSLGDSVQLNSALFSGSIPSTWGSSLSFQGKVIPYTTCPDSCPVTLPAPLTEPSTFALLAFGFVLLGYQRHKRSR